jgi:predicted TIM-barrel fold metal-dependent hydrolase
MPVIDADCHVIENDHTWDYFDEAEKSLQPLSLVSTRPETEGRRFMSVDGRVRSVGFAEARGGAGEEMSGYSQTSAATRTLADVQARIRHMDELGVDVQVLYPTLFLTEQTARPKTEAALCRSYNRWLADIWEQSDNRLRWAAVLPLLDMKESLNQLRWSVEHGACAIFMRGYEGRRTLSDPYFYPLYEEGQRLNVPVCVHAGCANTAFRELARETFSVAKIPVISSFHAILTNEIPTKFPELRFGFIEAAATWLPYVITDLRRRLIREGKELSDRPLADNRMYVTCQTNDDLPFVLKYAGEDNLIIGSDYGHADTSAELDALRNLHETTPVSPEVIKKILEDNPKALYGL